MHQGTITLNYLERDQFVGAEQRFLPGYEGRSCYSPHIARFCPVCGELWGRIICSFSFDYQPHVERALSWIVRSQRCASCGDGTLLGDSLLDEVDAGLLRRELLLLLERQ